MAKSQMFSKVPDMGFLSVGESLQNQTTWEEVKADAIVSRAQPVTATLPKDVLWKARLLWSIAALSACLGIVDHEKVKQTKKMWKNAQQRLHHKTEFDARDSDPAINEAAQRVRGALLLGNGLAQTQLSLEEAIDFAHKQLELSQGELLSQDINDLKLQPLIDDIRTTTAQLTAALGITSGKNRDAARSLKIRQALSECRATFRAVLDDLNWLLSCELSHEEAKRLQTLRAPLVALHERYLQPDVKPKSVQNESADSVVKAD